MSRDVLCGGKIVSDALDNCVVRTFPIHCLSTAHTLNSFLESIDTGRAVLWRKEEFFIRYHVVQITVIIKAGEKRSFLKATTLNFIA